MKHQWRYEFAYIVSQLIYVIYGNYKNELHTVSIVEIVETNIRFHTILKHI